MMADRRKILDEVFIAPGTIRVSEAALQKAREFAAASGAGPGGSRVVAFDWAQSIAVGSRGGPSREVGPCLILGAYERNDVPPGFTERVGRFEFAVRMPLEVLAKSTERLIDIDDSKPFQLVLR
jgi:hypothetical protein